MASVLVIGETTPDGALTQTTTELLGTAGRLAAGLGGGVACAFLGSGVAAAASTAAHYGANTVYVADAAALAAYQTDPYVKLVTEIVRQDAPRVLLLGQTSLGRDVAPRVAARLNSAAAMDALDLALDGDRVKVTRACYGGAARQVVTVETTPQVITVRPKSQDPPPADPGRTATVVPVAVDAGVVRAKLVNREQAPAAGVRLEDAEIIISGGRGLGSPEAFRDLEALAARIGAAVGASRAACDLGWYPPSQQVGLTGTVVSPTLYVAIAISGASQHIAGCGGSKNIIAINKDPEANIFRYCKFGIVDDYKKVLPAFSAALVKAITAP